MRKHAIHKQNSGFTLVEIIITLIIAGLVGVAVATFLRNATVKSVEPVSLVKDINTAQSLMEKIAKDYYDYTKDRDWSNFENDISSYNATITDVSSSFEDVEVIEVQVTQDEQNLTALFPKIEE